MLAESLKFLTGTVFARIVGMSAYSVVEMIMACVAVPLVSGILQCNTSDVLCVFSGSYTGEGFDLVGSPVLLSPSFQHRQRCLSESDYSSMSETSRSEVCYSC